MITDEKNGIIFLQRLCQYYLEEKHQILRDTFIV